MRDTNSKIQTGALTFLALTGSVSCSEQICRLPGKWLILLIALIGAGVVYGFVAYLLRKKRIPANLRWGEAPEWTLWRIVLAAVLFCLSLLILFSTAGMWFNWVLVEWPLWLILVLLITTVFFMLTQGGKAICRGCVLGAAIFFVVLIADTLFLIPCLKNGAMPQVASTFPWQDALLLFLLLAAPAPILLWYGKPGRQGTVSIAIGFFLGMATLVWQALRDGIVLGKLTTVDQWPILRTLSFASAGAGFERVESWGVMALTGGALFAVAIFLHGAKEMLMKKI